MKTLIETLKDQMSSTVDTLLIKIDGYLDGGAWHGFRNFLLLSDKIDSFRTHQSFKEGVYIVCEISIGDVRIGNYLLDNLTSYSSIIKMIEVLDSVNGIELDIYGLDEEDSFILKAKLRVIAECIKAVIESESQLKKAA